MSEPLHVGVVLFPGFQALDAFGPLDILNVLSWTHQIKLSVLSNTLDPVTTRSAKFPTAVGQLIQPTHTFAAPPPGLNVLLVPGGTGVRDTEASDPAVAFVRDQFPSLRYLITVCTGSWLVARAGVLDGRRATTNKRAFKDVAAKFPAVEWVGRARFVVDGGNVWTASGVSAGMDVTLAWVAEVFGVEAAEEVATVIEYEWVNRDGKEDPFAGVYGL